MVSVLVSSKEHATEGKMFVYCSESNSTVMFDFEKACKYSLKCQHTLYRVHTCIVFIPVSCSCNDLLCGYPPVGWPSTPDDDVGCDREQASGSADPGGWLGPTTPVGGITSITPVGVTHRPAVMSGHTSVISVQTNHPGIIPFDLISCHPRPPLS